MIWSLLNPFMMLLIYTLAFGSILRARWPGADSTGDFALILFVGIAIHGFFAECVGRAPTLVTSNANYVTRIIFPLDILPWPVLVSGLFHFAMNLLVFICGVAIVKGSLPSTIVLLPLVVMPLALVILGGLWLLSSLGTFLRDIGQLVGPLLTAMLFLSSAIVPVDAIPQSYRWIFELNPLTLVIDQARNVALYGVSPDWGALGIYTGISLLFCCGSYLVFGRLRRGFADVL